MNRPTHHSTGPAQKAAQAGEFRRYVYNQVSNMEKIMRKLPLIAIAVFTTAVAHAEPIVDVLKIAGKSENEVSNYLGSASSCGKSKYGNKCQYAKGETEVVFINGKADWITVDGIDSIPFTKSVLAAIGLNEVNPSFSNNFTLRWNSIQGLMEVSIFKGDSTSDYAYIKVKTK